MVLQYINITIQLLGKYTNFRDTLVENRGFRLQKDRAAGKVEVKFYVYTNKLP